VSLIARVLAAAAAVALVAPAAAPGAASPVKSPKLWATINLCDTPGHPDTIGVRGSMPGTGHRGDRMYMRIRIDSFDPATQSWVPIGGDGDSGRFYVGSGTRPVRQAGMNVTYGAPTAGTTTLRGDVTFQWRRKHHVVYSAEKLTEPGHPDASQADPAGYSAATCDIHT
jgi:opacity protein-like surface antigen